jgi:hypothetical protein
MEGQTLMWKKTSVSAHRYVFLRGADGRITGFAQRREAWDLVRKRAAPVPKP